MTMLDFLIENLDPSKWLDGVLLGLGVLTAYLGGVLTLSLVRSFGAVGGAGFVWAGKIIHGRYLYNRGHSADIVNVTLNTLVNNKLSVDTIVGDQLLMDVWANPYHVMRLKAAAKLCTPVFPVITFPITKAETQRKVDEYRVTYDTLVSMIAERCTNNNSIDLALGKPMREHRFVVALTFEKHCDIRQRHFRAMMLLEDELLNFPESAEGITFDREGQASRFETLKQIAQQYKQRPERFGIVKVWRPMEQPLPQETREQATDRANAAIVSEMKQQSRPSGWGRLGGGGGTVV